MLALGLAARPRARCAAPCCVRDDVTVSPEITLPSGLRVGTLEPDDLPHCIEVLLECFYKDTLTLAEAEFSEEEMEKLRPALQLVNGAFTNYNRVALTQTTRLRLGRRLLSRLSLASCNSAACWPVGLSLTNACASPCQHVFTFSAGSSESAFAKHSASSVFIDGAVTSSSMGRP